MAEKPKVLYVIVNDEGDDVGPGHGKRECTPPRYTRSVLQTTLQLMGCKARHAFKISDRVFDVLGSGLIDNGSQVWHRVPESKPCCHVDEATETEQVEPHSRTMFWKDLGISSPENSLPTKKGATVTVSREKFLDVVCDALAEYQYVGPNQRADLMLSCRVREKKTSVTVLLCGTSGCGKSTLSSLLASRLGITTVVSTDSVRHMMRSFVSKEENPLLWASTYHAGECLDPVAIAESKLKKKDAKYSIMPRRSSVVNGRARVLQEYSSGSSLSFQDTEKASTNCSELDDSNENCVGLCEKGSGSCNVLTELAHIEGSADVMVGSKTMVVHGFKAQSEMVIDSLDRLITSWEQKNESVVVEGVHLSLNFVMGLMKKHPSIVPFMVYISNECKHLERFAVRAKYMTLDPAKNKYVKYIRNIRTIQGYLCKRADKHLVPKVNNTNVDKSIALIHATIFSCLRRRMGGEPLWDHVTNTVKVVDQEYRSQYAASSLGSKGMFQLIQRRGSSRHLMALMNTDGSVAKAWPIDSDCKEKAMTGSSNCNRSQIEAPVYGPLVLGKSEPVNLQFGSFGLSAWLTDAGAASYLASHISIGDGNTSHGGGESKSSCPGSVCSSSLKDGEGGDKELTEEEMVVSASDEEPDEDGGREAESDGEVSDCDREQIDGDEDGSVDDQSERSDEDGDDYGNDRLHDDGFWSEDTYEGENKQEHLRRKDGGADAFVNLPVIGQDTILMRNGGHTHRSHRGLHN